MTTEAYLLSIDGRAVSGEAMMDVLNPANGKVFAQAPDATRIQLDEAVAAARRAFPGWAARPVQERKALVSRIGDAIEAELDLLKRLLTQEQGKPLEEAEWEVRGAALWCGAATALDLPVVINEDGPERHSLTRRVPLGVVGAIAPWNFPVVLAMWKVVPALIAGNTVVLKPSPFTPLTTLRIGQIIQGVLPSGVVNVVSGGDRLGPWMTEHPGIDKISFTGSTATGRKVMASASVNLKRLTLELGGNDPAIVLPDVDVAKVVPELFWAAFRNTGQVCVATKRMYIHTDVYDAVADGLAAYARGVRIGDGSIQGVQLGPIQNAPQHARVCALIEGARASGLRFLTGGETTGGEGYFVPITILDDPPDDAPVVVEEAFGPVLPLLRFVDVDDAIRRANNSVYGLAASVWSKDEARAHEIAARLACGTVWINEAQHLTPFAAFGGHGQSGFGVENGLEGLLEYTNPQTVSVRKRDVASAA